MYCDLADVFVSQAYYQGWYVRMNGMKIKVLYNTGEMKNFSEASDIFHLQNLMETNKKYFLCYPKDLEFNC